MKRYLKIVSLSLFASLTLIGCQQNKVEEHDYNIPIKDSETVEANHFANGVLPGEFSISKSDKIQFSQGNLQYQASTKVWRFAENQYDFVGGENYGIEAGNNHLMSATYDGWIDLFAWSADEVSFAPYLCSKNASDYKNYTYTETDTVFVVKYNLDTIYTYEYVHHLDTVVLQDTSYVKDVIDTTKIILAFDTLGIDSVEHGIYLKVTVPNAAWGTAPIANASASDTWRTLTNKEWNYLLTGRKQADKLCAAARVGGVNGILLFPDNATIPSTIVLGFGNLDGQHRYAYVNNLSIDDLRILEKDGAVFLPAAGHRHGEEYSSAPLNADMMNLGCYWANNSSFTDTEIIFKDKYDEKTNEFKTKEKLRDEQLKEWDETIFSSYYAYFTAKGVSVISADYSYGASVRLVKEVK